MHSSTQIWFGPRIRSNSIPATWNLWVSKRGEDGIGWQVRRMSGDPIAGFTVRGVDNEDGWGSSINVNDGNWHHYVGMWEQATGTRRLYVDGVFSHVVNNNPSQTMALAPAKHLALGAREQGGTGFEGFLSASCSTSAFTTSHLGSTDYLIADGATGADHSTVDRQSTPHRMAGGSGRIHAPAIFSIAGWLGQLWPGAWG